MTPASKKATPSYIKSEGIDASRAKNVAQV